MITEDHVQAHLDKLLDKAGTVGDLPFTAGCSQCQGGLLPGDHVPYGSTTAQLPPTWCDCVWERGEAYVQDLVDAQELVLIDNELQEPQP
jgi:hypothetical protein